VLKEIVARVGQGFRTSSYPDVPPTLPERFRGKPRISSDPCPEGCSACLRACPTAAVEAGKGTAAIDLGKCLFCGACAEACPQGSIQLTREHRMAAARRDDIWIRSEDASRIASALNHAAQRIFGRSLRLRQVSAGGCAACEADLNVLGTIAWDIGRFGIEFVASPRHADGIVVTGPVTENMALALRKTWDATPEPKIVIAVGACAISGGPFAGNAEVRDGAIGSVPVDLFVPGCPPHPFTILDGMLRMLGRISEPGQRR